MKTQLVLALSKVNFRYVFMALTILAVAMSLLLGPGAPEVTGDFTG